MIRWRRVLAVVGSVALVVGAGRGVSAQIDPLPLPPLTDGPVKVRPGVGVTAGGGGTPPKKAPQPGGAPRVPPMTP